MPDARGPAAVLRIMMCAVIGPQPGDEEMLALEVEVLRQLSHPNIIHLYKYVSLALSKCLEASSTAQTRSH